MNGHLKVVDYILGFMIDERKKGARKESWLFKLVLAKV
jgi:hypothetical protein